MGAPAEWQQAILGHAAYTGVPRTTPMAQALFAVDELSRIPGRVRPGAPVEESRDLEVASVKKKLKDKGFARGVSRDDITTGAAELGMPLEELISFVLEALRPDEELLGLGDVTWRQAM